MALFDSASPSPGQTRQSLVASYRGVSLSVDRDGRRGSLGDDR